MYTFQGRQLDPETGLIYFRMRMYSTEQGRFISRDPLLYVDGLGLHEFVGGNPENAWDPMGGQKRRYKIMDLDITDFAGGQEHAQTIENKTYYSFRISLLDLLAGLNKKYPEDVDVQNLNKFIKFLKDINPTLDLRMRIQIQPHVGDSGGFYKSPGATPDYPFAVIHLPNKRATMSTVGHELIHHWEFFAWGKEFTGDLTNPKMGPTSDDYFVGPDLIGCILDPCKCKAVMINEENLNNLILYHFLVNILGQTMFQRYPDRYLNVNAVTAIAGATYIIEPNSSEAERLKKAAEIIVKVKDIKNFYTDRKK